MSILFLGVFPVIMLWMLPERVPSSYPFPNPLEDIVSVELLYNHNGSNGDRTDESNIQIIRELSKEEIPAFMKKVYALETKRYNPPLWGWGCYIARVTYCNGDVEMLGSLNIEYIAAGMEPTGTSAYFFTNNGFTNVFSDYIDTTEYPWFSY